LKTETTKPGYFDTTPAATPSVPAPSALRKTFIGQNGLRAGWSLLIFVALLAAIGFGVSVTVHRLYPSAPTTAKAVSDAMSAPSFVFIGESSQFLLVLLVTWIMSKIERRPISVYGLGDSRKLQHFLAGLAWGVSCLSLLVLMLWKSGLLVIDRRQLFGSDVVRFGAIWLLCFLLAGFFEEYFSRGYVQYTLTRGLAGFYRWAFKSRHSTALGFWTSAVIFSTLFGLSHRSNPGESPIGLLSAGLIALILCLSLWRTGSLWWAIGFHASWDWGQSFVYGVGDSGLVIQHHLLASHPEGKSLLSGGSTGPEGSIFILAVLVLITAVMLLTLPRTRYGQVSKALGTTD
jgi:hypothetical protein